MIKSVKRGYTLYYLKLASQAKQKQPQIPARSKAVHIQRPYCLLQLPTYIGQATSNSIPESRSERAGKDNLIRKAMKSVGDPNEKIIRDLTVGSVPKTLLGFAMPLFLSGILQLVYNLVDMVVVGRFVGTNGLSAVAIGGEVMMLITFVAMGFSNAGQVLLSRHIGEKRYDLVGKLVGTLLTFFLILAVCMTGILLPACHGILRLLNTPQEIFSYTSDYSMVCIAGIIFIYGYNLSAAILRGLGDSKHPFMFIAIASIINIILDLLFVGVIGLGPFGAALATVIGQAVSFLFALRILYRDRTQICFDFHRSSFRLYKDTFGSLMRLGIPMAIQSAAIAFSMLFVNSYINVYGTIAVAVTGVARKIENMIQVIAQAVSTAGATMVSQALGAGKTKRVPKIVFSALGIVAVPASVLALINWFRPEWLFRLFSSDTLVLQMAVRYVPVAMIQFLGCTLRPANFALINGSGYARLSLIIAILDGVIARIGLALLLGIWLDGGIMGFWYGNALAGLMPFFVGGIYLLSGAWKKRASVSQDL